MRSEQDVNTTIDQYTDTIARLCMVYLKNPADSEDISQTVFLKYALCDTVFESEEHKKAWLIRVTVNACRDLLKSFFHSRTVSLDTLLQCPAETTDSSREVLEAVLALPKQYREVIYLHYYEGYTAPEIGQLLKKNTNTIYTLLRRAKEILKVSLGGELNG